MKSMTCKQLGGACDVKFSADTFDQIAELSKKHGMAMFQKGDKEHLEAMGKMRRLLNEQGAVQKWMEEKRKEFDALKED